MAVCRHGRLMHQLKGKHDHDDHDDKICSHGDVFPIHRKNTVGDDVREGDNTPSLLFRLY